MGDDEGPTTATDEETDVVGALADHAVHLETTDPAAGADDLAPLADLLGEARVIGLGEPTHGTRECFRLKDRLLRWLVTEHDLRLMGLEANFPEALAIDRYVVHGEGDPAAALEAVYFWTWQAESVVELLEWLRSFNADRPLDDRVRFHGFDVQYARGAVEYLEDVVEQVAPEFLERVREDLATAHEGESAFEEDGEALLARTEATERLAATVRDHLDDERWRYVDDHSERVWGLARGCTDALDRVARLKRARYERETDDALEPDEQCLRVRDRGMAETAAWLLDLEDADRMALWGHDAHLNREAHRLPELGVSAPSMGVHLADRFGDDYVALGFAVGGGTARAFAPDPDAEGDDERTLRTVTLRGPLDGTIDAELADALGGLAVVDLRAASEDDRLADWCQRRQEHFSIGAVYDPDEHEKFLTEYAYGEALDAVCYLPESTATRPIAGD